MCGMKVVIRFLHIETTWDSCNADEDDKPRGSGNVIIYHASTFLT